MKNTLKLLMLFGFALSGLSSTVASDPNIVIILVDDMGYGDAACYNSKSLIATPNIDRLAATGMKFTDAHAPGPLCHLSRYGLLTGRYPFRGNPEAWRNRATIDQDQMTFASFTRSVGYRTAMVGKWHLGFDENGYENDLPGGPVDRGFDRFFGIRASTDIPPYFYIRVNRAVEPPTDVIDANDSEGWSKIQGAFWRAGGIAPTLKLDDVLPKFTDEAIRVVRQHAGAKSGKPLMLHLAYPAPHTPWLPSKRWQGKSEAGMYGDFMMMVDHEVGRVVQALQSAEMLKDTLLVFTSDNGPCWYEADDARVGHDSSGGLKGMKADAWEGGHRMPFIVRWPGRVQPGTESDQLVCFTDLLSTIADVVGRPLPETAGPDSFSFFTALTGEDQTMPVRSELAMKTGSGLPVIRVGEWKLIDGLGSGGFSSPRREKPTVNGPAGQLFNLAGDRGETENLFLSHPEKVAALKKRLQQVLQADGHRFLLTDQN